MFIFPSVRLTIVWKQQANRQSQVTINFFKVTINHVTINYFVTIILIPIKFLKNFLLSQNFQYLID